MGTGMKVVGTLLAVAALACAGEWIWTGVPGDVNPKNRFTYFRKVVDLAAAPSDATLRLAADSNAHVWINGHIVRRKVTRFHEDRITAEVIHAGPYLRKGKNVVVVLHHNWGPIITFQRSANAHAGLRVDSRSIQSDASWRWITAPEFLAHEKQVVGIIKHARIRYAEVVDGRKVFAANVHDPAFDDSDWKHAAVVQGGPWPANPVPVETAGMREYPVRPPSVLAAGRVDRAAPDLADPFSAAAGIRAGVYDPEPSANTRVFDGKAGEWRYVTFDFERPVHGYPFVEIDSSAPGAVVDFGYAETAVSMYRGAKNVDANGWMNPEAVVGPGYGDRYIARAGVQRIEMPDERTARWFGVQIYFPQAGRVTLRDAGFIKSQYPVRIEGSFDCGDERIAQIVKLALIHAEVTMNDVYVDTPGREDGQWIEDSRVRALISERWFGDWRLRQVLLRHYAESQGKDGGFHAFPPANFPAYPVNYDWSVQWAAMLYDDYYWTGNTTLIERYWNTLERYWNDVLSHVGEDGVFRTNRVFADIRVGVHPSNAKQSSGIVTPFVIDRLNWSAEMAAAVGKTGQARAWKTSAEKMTAAFRKWHIVPQSGGRPALTADRFESPDSAAPRGFSQAAQAMAILAGMMTRDEVRAALDYTYPDPDGTPPERIARWNNPTFAYRSLRVLSDSGLASRAVAHLIERYSPYLPRNPRNRTPIELQGPYGGPLPEYWVSREDLKLKDGEPNKAQPEDDTGSHGWGAVPLLWLHDSLLGVRVTEPGGGRLRVAPEDGGLPYAAGTTITPKGPVWVNWEPGHLRLEVRLPQGVVADLVLPRALAGKRVRVEHAGVSPARGANGSYALAEAGSYAFTAY